MPTFLIERHIPGAGKLTQPELRAISKQSVGVIGDLGPDIRWLHSYVVDDRIYCVHEAPSPALIEEHARCMGIPANAISEIRAIISPETASS